MFVATVVNGRLLLCPELRAVLSDAYSPCRSFDASDAQSDPYRGFRVGRNYTDRLY